MKDMVNSPIKKFPDARPFEGYVAIVRFVMGEPFRKARPASSLPGSRARSGDCPGRQFRKSNQDQAHTPGRR